MYVLLDRDILSASMEITYSVQVVLRVRLAQRRNFPFSTSKAARAVQQSINITMRRKMKRILNIHRNAKLRYSSKQLIQLTKPINQFSLSNKRQLPR